jgi:hypothetical protein
MTNDEQRNDENFSAQDEWGELTSKPPRVSQAQLAEFVRRKEAVRVPLADLEAVANEVSEMLIMGSQVERGLYTARLESSRLIVEVHPEPDKTDLDLDQGYLSE